MKKLIFAALLSMPATSWAGKLDLDYYHPSPAKAFMWSAVAPAGGMFYLASQTSWKNADYVEKGLLYIAAESVVIYLVQNQARHGKNIFLPLTVLMGIKIFEFDAVIDAAETERHKRMMSDLVGE